MMRVAFHFCKAVPVAGSAKAVGLSAKSVRALYLDFRQRLTKPKFNPWTAIYQRIIWATSLDQEEQARTDFIEDLEKCYSNETCYRNFRLGNRKSRLCRSCLLPNYFSKPDGFKEAIDIVDTVRTLYDYIGIKSESDYDPVSLFRLRMVHVAIVSTIVIEEHAAKVNGKAHLKYESPLSLRKLLNALLDDLAADAADPSQAGPPRADTA